MIKSTKLRTKLKRGREVCEAQNQIAKENCVCNDVDILRLIVYICGWLLFIVYANASASRGQSFIVNNSGWQLFIDNVSGGPLFIINASGTTPISVPLLSSFLEFQFVRGQSVRSDVVILSTWGIKQNLTLSNC